MVNSVFKETIYKVLEKIKKYPYFKWPNKIVGTPPKGIRACIANIIKTEAIQPRIAEPCATT